MNISDGSMKIRVRLSVDVNSVNSLLQKIRSTNWKFDFDILILDVENGPDIFLTVTGEYKPSCFGVPVDALCRTDRPMCEYTQNELKNLVNIPTKKNSLMCIIYYLPFFSGFYFI